MADPLCFGIIGTGGIAGDFAQALSRSKRCRVVNVVGSSPEKAKKFAQVKEYGIPASAASLDEFLADKNVQAVYIATPHPSHEAQAIACIEAKKHVLCEKPMTMDAAGTERVVAAAKKHGVFLMEAWMYRCHPLMKELIAALKGGVIGDIRHVRADFSFRVPRAPNHRLYDLKLGGGGILDVGGYPVSFARLIAGLIDGKPFSEPTRLEAIGTVGPTGADEIATALLWFESGFNAVVSCAVHHEGGRKTVVFGEKGRIELSDPWIPGSDRQSRETGFTIHLDDRKPEFVPIHTDVATYALEAEEVAATLPAVEGRCPR
jgi:predicted dehydrogenase